MRSPDDFEIPGRVAPARSGLPPRGADERGRSDVGLSERGRSELLCGRDEEEGRSDVGLSERGRSELLCERDEDDGRLDGLPLEERPDVEPLEDPDFGRGDGRDDPPRDEGRRDSMTFTPFRVVVHL